MISEENDISDTSKSAKRSCRQKSSDGCTGLGISVIPSGLTLPSKTGQVLGLEAIAMLMGMFTAVLDAGVYREIIAEEADTKPASAIE